MTNAFLGKAEGSSKEVDGGLASRQALCGHIRVGARRGESSRTGRRGSRKDHFRERVCPVGVIYHTSYFIIMPLVQAVVPESEYDLLRQRARKEGKPMKAVIREALRAHLVPDSVDSEDPIFHIFPLQKREGRTRWISRDHDELLYPTRR